MPQKETELQYEENEGFQPSAAFALLGVVWRHKWLLVLGLAVGLIIGVLYSSQLTPEYQSSLKLLVIKKRPENLPGMDPRGSGMENYLATHQAVIRSPRVVADAVQKGNLQALASFEKSGDPIGEIIQFLGVTRESTEGGATSILNLSYRSAVPDDCAKVLDAVKDSYKVFIGDTYQNVSDETLDLITKAKKILDERLTKKEGEYQEFRRTNPVLLRGKDGMNVWQERLLNIETKRFTLMVRKAELKERLDTFKNGMESGKDRSKLLAMVAESNDRPRGDKDDVLEGLQVQEETLLEDFGPDHPQLKAVRKRIESVLASRSTKIEKRPIDRVDAHLQSLQLELDELRTSETVLAKLLEREQESAKEMIINENKDENFRKDIARENQLFEGIVKRLQEINLFKDLGGYKVEVINPASPAWKVGPRNVPIFLVAGFLGLVGGMALAYLAEVTDQSFRNPEEIRRRLGMQIVGQIPVVSIEGKAVRSGKETPAGLAPILCTFHHPKSRTAEAYRGVRTGLFFSTQGKGHKVIQVTSPSAGDGKSTLAANLAISISQAEKRVLLVDADFRRPTIHTLFGVSPERGLASVLLGEAELVDVIQPSGIANLSVLPCGPIPANPAELLSLTRFKELLDYIRDQYDFVIIDTPPILAVTDPCMVVPLVDGVLLTLRPSKHAQPTAVRAKEVLATLDARMIGVVVNAVAEQKSGYGYGGYGYGYGDGEKYYQHQEPAVGATKKGDQ